MKLVMFDIDGTLTQTFAVDAGCFVAAVKEVAGFHSISTDWASYQHTSDSGIVEELYQLHVGRSPFVDETNAVKQCFVDLLSQAASKSVDAFASVPGAQSFVDRLIDSGHAVSLASGGWEESARLKLTKANLHFENIPAAFANDALPRCEIMLCSYRRACINYGVNQFEEVTYFGDGLWDAIASKSLGYKFVGVATGESAERLTQLGAIDVMPDFVDINRAVAAING